MELLKKLVEMDTSNLEAANDCIEYCHRYLMGMGIEGEVLEHKGVKSYVATIGSGEKTIVMNGHVDVVSGKPNQFIPRVEGDLLYGRGTADMKGGVAAMTNAFCSLNKFPLGCKVMLQLVADEEIGGQNGTKFLVESGFIGDFVICTEPTNLEISVSAKGIIRLDIVTSGHSAHGSRPWEGENAIIKAIENFKKIEALSILNESSRFYDKTSVNLAFIKGGNIYNRVPDEALMGLDIRYVPHLNPHEVIKQIKEVVDGEVITRVVEPAIYVSEDCAYVKEFYKTVQEVISPAETKFVGQHGSSDARFFSGLGIPAIEFGPRGAAWHGDSECVSIKSVNQLTEILIEFIKGFKA